MAAALDAVKSQLPDMKYEDRQKEFFGGGSGLIKRGR
jgi:hypothetical protein